MAYQSITKRWLFNSLGFVVILLMAAEVAMIFFVRDYYYSSAQRIVQSSADFGASYMQSSYGDSRVNFTAMPWALMAGLLMPSSGAPPYSV